RPRPVRMATARLIARRMGSNGSPQKCASIIAVVVRRSGNRLSRRALLRTMGALPAAPLLPLLSCRAGAPAVIAPAATDIRIVEVQHRFEDFLYRTPYQFGGRTVDRVTILNVDCRVRTGDGKESWGFGSMTLGNAWAFPAASHESGLGAMKALADAL